MRVVNGSHQVIAVGTVVTTLAPGVTPSVGPDHENHVPIHIFSVESCASNILTPGITVLWPLTLLAHYKPPSAKQPVTEQKTQTDEPGNKVSDIPLGTKDDRLMNYGFQILQLGLMLMQLNDTEAEGDGERSILNWKMLMLYFRCRPKGMKYGFEAMRFITCVRALYTERLAHRVIHGQFVNSKGGAGRNYANDLKMEHLVRHNKTILKGLCGNKTLKAVERCSKAAYGVKRIVNQFDTQSDIAPESTSHTHACTTDDVKDMIKVVHNCKPFQCHPGRSLYSFPNITKTPLDKLNVGLLHTWLTRHKRKLFANSTVEITDDESCDGDSSIGEQSSDGDTSDEESNA